MKDKYTVDNPRTEDEVRRLDNMVSRMLRGMEGPWEGAALQPGGAHAQPCELGVRYVTISSSYIYNQEFCMDVAWSRGEDYASPMWVPIAPTFTIFEDYTSHVIRPYRQPNGREQFPPLELALVGHLSRIFPHAPCLEYAMLRDEETDEILHELSASVILHSGVWKVCVCDLIIPHSNICEEREFGFRATQEWVRTKINYVLEHYWPWMGRYMRTSMTEAFEEQFLVAAFAVADNTPPWSHSVRRELSEHVSDNFGILTPDIQGTTVELGHRIRLTPIDSAYDRQLLRGGSLRKVDVLSPRRIVRL